MKIHESAKAENQVDDDRAEAMIKLVDDRHSQSPIRRYEQSQSPIKRSEFHGDRRFIASDDSDTTKFRIETNSKYPAIMLWKDKNENRGRSEANQFFKFFCECRSRI